MTGTVISKKYGYMNIKTPLTSWWSIGPRSKCAIWPVLSKEKKEKEKEKEEEKEKEKETGVSSPNLFFEKLKPFILARTH